MKTPAHNRPFPRRLATTAAILLGICLFARVTGQATAPATASARDLTDLSLEQLLDTRIEKVYGASKYEQRVTEAPAAVTIVSAEAIARAGQRTLADVLRSVRGLYVTYDRNYSNFGIRGFNRPGDFNTRVLLLVNGHRMNDNLYDSALIGPEAILDVDLIERVEIIRGPSSSIYGSNAFFGVIDVITRDAASLDGVEVSAEGGSFGTYKGRLTFGRKFQNGAELVLSGSLADSAGPGRLYFPEFDTPQQNNGVAEDADAEHARNLFARLSVGEWSLAAGWSRRAKQVPTASFSTVFNDGRERTTDERFFADLKWHRAFTAGREFTGRVYYDRYFYHADYPYDFAGPAGPPFVVVTHDDNLGEGLGAEAQVTQKIDDRHTLVAGAEIRESLTLRQSNYFGTPPVYGSLSEHDGRSLGLYAQGEFAVRPGFLANAGVRYDTTRDFGGTVNPRLGVVFSPTETATFKLLYGRAYRAPNAYEQFQASPGFSKANPDLTPEFIRTYEAVYEHYLPHDLRLAASAYYYDISDLISQRLDPADGLLVFQNIDTVTAKGLEFELESNLGDRGLRTHLSYALQRAEDGRTGDELNNSPRHLAKLGLNAPLAGKKIHAGLELQYTSSVKTLAGRQTAGFLIVNATLFSQKLAEHLEFSATIYNLLDRNYAYPGSTGHFQDVIPQDGRSFRIKVTERF